MSDEAQSVSDGGLTPMPPVETQETEPGLTIDDYQALFTPDDVKAKQESLAAAKAEEERRSKLTKEELEAEDKLKADSEAADKVPEEYAEFKIPKGMSMDTELLNEAVPMFKELGLSQEKAQKVIDLYAEKIAPAYLKRQADAWEAQKTKWAEEVKADKEIGGEKFESSVKDAVRVINTLGTPALKKVFDDYGLGNHPEFVRVFAKMATHMKEDTLVTGDKAPIRGRTIEDMAARIYGAPPAQQ